MKKFFTLVSVVSVVVLSACSSGPQYKGVYDEIKTTPSLEIPPGLDKPGDTGAVLPELGQEPKSFSEYTSTQGKPARQGYLPSYKNIYHHEQS